MGLNETNHLSDKEIDLLVKELENNLKNKNNENSEVISFSQKDLEVIKRLYIEDASDKEKKEQLDLYNSIFTIRDYTYYWSHIRRMLIKIGKSINSKNEKLIYHIKEDFKNQIKQEKKTKNATETDVLKNGRIFLNASAENIIYSVHTTLDIFADKTTLVKDNNYLYIQSNRLNFSEKIFAMNISQNIKDAVVADYKIHFKELDEVLEWLSATVMTNDRRDSFLYLLVNASWGKSYFLSMLEKIGLFYEMQAEDFKTPSGVRPQDLEGKIGIAIDEFTKFKREYKKLTHSLTLEPKFEYRSKVPLFAKLFLSAEASLSFQGSIDKQLTERVLVIDKTEDKSEIIKRQLFKRIGGDIYHEILCDYIDKKIKDEFKMYKEIGRMKSPIVAREKMDIFKDKYSFKNSLSVEQDFEIRAKTLIYNLVMKIKNQTSMNANERYICDNFLYLKINRKKEEEVIIKAHTLFKEAVLKNEDTEFASKAKYVDFLRVMNTESTSNRIGGEVVNGCPFLLKDIIDFVIGEEDDEIDEEIEAAKKHPKVTLVDPTTGDESEILF